MTKVRLLVAALVLLSTATAAQAGLIFGRFIFPGDALARANRKICGRILDYTYNHGRDNRIYSEALCEKRDMYVYLPPDYDPGKLYPLIIFMHGFSQDEQAFLELAIFFDDSIRHGRCPPAIVAAPDGSIRGKPGILNAGSFFVNSKAGRFEDFVMQDVWTFMHTCFPIRSEREAHAFVGGSMGGFSVYNLGIKYREAVRNIAAVFPPLNLRYLDCHGRYFADFDPNCLGWRQRLRPLAPVARYAHGLITIRQRRMINPLFGRQRGAIDLVAAENPIELLDVYDVRPGELEMYIGYAGKDEFNIDAQVESFLHFARCRGLCITVAYMPKGHHNVSTGNLFFPSLITWLGQRLAPYGPIPAPVATRP